MSSRTEPVTVDDVAAAGQAAHLIADAAMEVEDLRERCLRKDDHERARELKLAGFRLADALEMVEAAFR